MWYNLYFRLIRNIAANAVPDPETMRLMEVLLVASTNLAALLLLLYYCDHFNFLNLRFQLKLENRRVGSGEREHIEMGLSHQANGNYLLAVKSFTRSLL